MQTKKKATATVAPAPMAPKYDPTNPLIVQSDRSILVEVDNPKYAEARDALAPFAELVKSPEHIHTYRISNLSLWNAAAAGYTSEQMVEILEKYTKFAIPGNLPIDIAETVSRYGRVRLQKAGENELRLICEDKSLVEELIRQKKLKDYLQNRLGECEFAIEPAYRGLLKQALITVGYPAEDLAGYTEGAVLPLKLRDIAASGVKFHPRDYQKDAASVFHAGGDVRGGSGVIVLPCGAGKTIVGIITMDLVQRSTLVLTTSVTAVRQWRREILDKTTLTEEDVKEYTGDVKEIGAVTIATYQILTYRPGKKRKKSTSEPSPEDPENLLEIPEEEMQEPEQVADPYALTPENYPHFSLFDKRDWGLIIYDEVHLLPAPIFRVTANIQARRRLGLTATLIREDGREGDVFTLIGPKKFDVPWRELENKGWIASATCSEIRVNLPDDKARLEYAVADWRNKYRLASENPVKEDVVEQLLKQYEDKRVLIIGQYLTQLRSMSARFGLPLITGSTGNAEREDLYGKFRRGEVRHLVLSKVGNFAIDLPDANVLIQVSGTFGSRQEEAQRLGRILRPKLAKKASAEAASTAVALASEKRPDAACEKPPVIGDDGVPMLEHSDAHFYTIITRDTRELDFAHHRQMFLTEQGYSYAILDEREVLPPKAS